MNKSGSLNRSVATVKASVFSHATEDETKVEKALKNAILSEGGKMSSRRLSGYYKDPIKIMTVKVTRSRDASQVLKATIQALSSLDRLRVLDEIEDRTDDAGNLYIRLDKQKASDGELVLWDGGEAIDIQLKPATYPASRDVALRIISEGPVL